MPICREAAHHADADAIESVRDVSQTGNVIIQARRCQNAWVHDTSNDDAGDILSCSVAPYAVRY